MADGWGNSISIFFLNTLWMSACHQMAGMVPEWRESLKIYARAGASSVTCTGSAFQQFLDATGGDEDVWHVRIWAVS